ncbi:hypothetical protein MLOOGBEN_26865 [Bacillus sp. EB106-08-02-XG196]|uniref:hypothetical protein n=1 Tax=Bacillus sp. EB106-08-02-XG196 TaxID=2737049 RepID=UPI0015C49B90|nr:hypothetical protein [Bacillus sp. EB106-08-02-XG196]NWQ44314.1 hypothetical protein [Bacillus sp. EB106-08-02-XG196]
MKSKWKIVILSAFLSIGFLSACNADKRDSLNQENDVNFRPVQYDLKTNVNESNNDYKNQENRRFLHDETPEQTDDEME